MQIDIQHIAKLSRLSIEKEKVEKFQKEMENIVAMCEKLPPMDGDYTSVDPSNPMQLRQDEIRPSLKRDQLLTECSSNSGWLCCGSRSSR